MAEPSGQPLPQEPAAPGPEANQNNQNNNPGQGPAPPPPMGNPPRARNNAQVCIALLD